MVERERINIVNKDHLLFSGVFIFLLQKDIIISQEGDVCECTTIM